MKDITTEEAIKDLKSLIEEYKDCSVEGLDMQVDVGFNEERCKNLEKVLNELETLQNGFNTAVEHQTKLIRENSHFRYELFNNQKELEQEKEKNKTLEELLQGRLFELYNYYKDLAGSYQANCISKNKITNILGLDSTETEETILQYIQTLETENARLEDIENKKVQIEYELVFNKGADSIKDKINAKIYQLNNTDILEDQIAITYLKELLNKEE